MEPSCSTVCNSEERNMLKRSSSTDIDSLAKKPKLNLRDRLTSKTSNGFIRRLHDHSISPTSSDDESVERKDIENGCKGDKKESKPCSEDELSATLEMSPDLDSGPNSPDWLNDDYFDKRFEEHCSQTSKKDISVTKSDEVITNDQVKPLFDETEVKENTNYLDSNPGSQRLISANSNNNSVSCATIVANPLLNDRTKEGMVTPDNLEDSSVHVNNSTESYNHDDEISPLKSDTPSPRSSPLQSFLPCSTPQPSTTIPPSDIQSNSLCENLTVSSPDLSCSILPKSVNNADHTNYNDNSAVITIDNDSQSNDSVIIIPEEDVIIEKPNTSMPNNLHLHSNSIQVDANLILNIVPGSNLKLILQRLNQKYDSPNRVDLVLNEVLEGQLSEVVEKTEAEKKGDSEPEDRILRDVEEVRKLVPTADPNTIFYMLLESTCPEEERITNVIKQLSSTIPEVNAGNITVHNTNMPQLDKIPSDPLLKGNTLFDDMRSIARIFPNKDQNEIYAYLEGYHDKPNRVQLVTDELLMGAGSQSQTPPVGIEVQVSNSISNDIKEIPPQNARTDCQQKQEEMTNLQKCVQQLSLIFPDCDPNYLYEKLEPILDREMKIQAIAAEMFENRDYPKLKDTLDRKAKEENKKKLINLKLDIPEFLTMFPDPQKVFYDADRPVTEGYKQHALTQLLNQFLFIKKPFIEKTLETNKYHFTPALRELESEPSRYSGRYRKSTKYLRSARAIEQQFPEKADEFFFKELLFSKHEHEINEYIEKKKALRETQLVIARASGDLMECGCCYDDECIIEDMGPCTDGHLFCKECIRRSAEVLIGENKFEFPCLGEGCEHKFPIPILKGVLPHNVFSNVLKKIQEEEIRQADIPDLVSCPFCSFATIMPNPDDKVFVCLNPECLRESCRLCKEPNHVPLRCEEVEKGGETTMRTFIENRITEAMLRTCWKCKKKFFKIDGCNKMTCTCGATMCYVCRAPAIDYNHFNESKGCNAYTDMNELHRQEMEKAAKEAKEKYQNENPDTAGLTLKHDPMKLIEDMRRERATHQAQAVMGMWPVGFNYHPPPVFGGNYGEDYSGDSEEDPQYYGGETCEADSYDEEEGGQYDYY